MSIDQHFLSKHKYELLLYALVQHLFIGVFLSDMDLYVKIIWPINMILLGIASIGVFIEKGSYKKVIKNILFLLSLVFPISLSFIENSPGFMITVSAVYVLFFLFIFLEIIRFLLKPSYVNTDIISASACGYLLLIEINTFLMQIFFYQNSHSFNGLDTSSLPAVYMDLVYFCSITITSIGFGDITPNSHVTKLITSLFGIIGQFYTVVLVGILISKFTSKSNQ
ncbi:Ion transport 2 domain protein [Emticicia oligotrophica DSM 17448]|uniref:Ion transport 2 domain protein n=1 Tax=Emticicia oligotrophica (strain DSM 17448 / CIP 109782 / MTCC 6937 / GPTSA100-15) TaxID=929562 RepID=A0ABN4AJJ8_EMTOG|nr:potassium channel family protein [Emticicia oligotrophica]AFK02136.1 Ion transport 2 domain protein [Emticicia oligotrophica DSM 17448]